MSRTILGATALALLLGVGAVAIAQSGSDVRSNDRKAEKALDHEKLTPIRPIRRVGPDDWPAGDPNKRADDVNKPKETTGQAASDSKDSAKQGQAKQQSPEPPKQDQAKQEPPQQPPTQQPANQNTAQQQQPATHSQQANAPQQQQQKQDNFASIRLGTDTQGKVAINDAQEKQLVTALKRQRVRSTDVAVKVGAPPPPDIRLGAVSADMVSVLPQFRGYSFFTTRNELVIVEPADKKIVAVVPLSATQTASQPERERSSERAERSTERSVERNSERAERGASRRDTKRETVGAAVPSEEEIISAPVTGSSRAHRIERDEDAVVIERRYHRPRVFGIFRF
jgi:hypothetical protein